MQLRPLLDPDLLKACPYCRMINFRRVPRVLCFAIGNAQTMIEELMMEPLDRNVSKPVDRGGQHRAAVNLKVLRKVRAAAKETDAYRCLSDNHLLVRNSRTVC